MSSLSLSLLLFSCWPSLQRSPCFSLCSCCGAACSNQQLAVDCGVAAVAGVLMGISRCGPMAEVRDLIVGACSRLQDETHSSLSYNRWVCSGAWRSRCSSQWHRTVNAALRELSGDGSTACRCSGLVLVRRRDVGSRRPGSSFEECGEMSMLKFSQLRVAVGNSTRIDGSGRLSCLVPWDLSVSCRSASGGLLPCHKPRGTHARHQQWKTGSSKRSERGFQSKKDTQAHHPNNY